MERKGAKRGSGKDVHLREPRLKGDLASRKFGERRLERRRAQESTALPKELQLIFERGLERGNGTSKTKTTKGGVWTMKPRTRKLSTEKICSGRENLRQGPLSIRRRTLEGRKEGTIPGGIFEKRPILRMKQTSS